MGADRWQLTKKDLDPVNRALPCRGLDNGTEVLDGFAVAGDAVRDIVGEVGVSLARVLDHGIAGLSSGLEGDVLFSLEVIHELLELSFMKNRLVTAELGIFARQGSIVLKDVVTIREVLKSKDTFGWVKGRKEAQLRHGEGELVTEMEDLLEDRGEALDGDILAITLDEAVVGKTVHGRTGSAELAGLASLPLGEVEFCEG